MIMVSILISLNRCNEALRSKYVCEIAVARFCVIIVLLLLLLLLFAFCFTMARSRSSVKKMV